MIRVIQARSIPAAGSSEEIIMGRMYGFRLKSAAGFTAAPVLLSVIRQDGAVENPIAYTPDADGWIWFAKPARGLVVSAVGSTATSAEVWYSTEAGDRMDLAPRSIAVELAAFVTTDGVAYDTGPLDTTHRESLLVHAVTGGASACTLSLFGVKNDGSFFFCTSVVPPAGGNGTLYRVGSAGVASGVYWGSVLPKRIRLTVSASAGSTLTIVAQAR